MTRRQHSDLYFAACEKPELGGGIYHYVMDNDCLTFVKKYDVDRPMYLLVDGGKMHVIIREMTEGKLDSGYFHYDIAADGSLSNASTVVPTGGRCAAHLTASEGRIYVINYLSGNIVEMKDSGVVAEDVHSGIGTHPTRQEAPHTHFVRQSPDGKYLFCVDLGVDSIFVYDKNLQIVSVAKVPAGSGCRHLDYSPDGKTVYCANELTSTVTVFSYADGKLTPVATYAGLPADFEGISTAAAIRVSADGRVLYVSHRGHDSVCAYDIAGDGTVLKNPVWTKIAGVSPRDILVVGDRLFAANEKTDNVTVFEVDGKILTKLDSELKMPHPLCCVEG